VKPRDQPENHPAKNYQSIWDDLGLLDDGEFMLIVKYHKLIVMPAAMIVKTLRVIHRPHLGAKRTTLYARERYFWKGLGSDVKSMFNNCETCIQFSPSKPSVPMLTKILRTTSMALLSDCGTDLWQIGEKNFLVLVDRFSGFILCSNIPKKPLPQQLHGSLPGSLPTTL
jgi:hypothetical protein